MVNVAAELRELAGNLWWTWNPATIAAFREIDPALWRRVNHSPLEFLDAIQPEVLERRAEELALKARISFSVHRLQEYLQRRRRWGDVYAGPLRVNPVAYTSAEFGLHEAIPIYSGGLGALAGDMVKSASDLGIPIVGIGLLYAQGYFNQRLNASGWQQESYFEAELKHMPIERLTAADGSPLLIYVETRSGSIAVAVWRAHVGRSLLLLLDSDVEQNSESDRRLTGRLYGGDQDVRIQQELILGVGGMRALAALGIRPGVLHLNEGHSAFALLEAARHKMDEEGISFQEAIRRVMLRTVFTTHTPVEAGHDRFDDGLVEHVLGPLREQLGISHDDLMNLGRVRPGDRREMFCMTTLALKHAAKSNAVSALHGKIARRMWQGIWPGRSEHEVPIGHITNGVHVASWISPSMKSIFDAYLGPAWTEHVDAPETWAAVDAIDYAELWEANQITKARLIAYVQRQVCAQEEQRGDGTSSCELAKQRLDTAFLTIGFSRRFTTYKRADMLLADEGRLEQLVGSRDRPLQIVFSGKAHPRDDPGKRIIQRIFHMMHDPRFAGRIVFLEDYDINVARHLVQGVDLWLNTPRRPLEASGTSGMKALFNGVLNLSILDGWWAEAYDGTNGFAIGAGGEHSDPAEQDRRDTEALYDALEQEVIPLYYDQDELGVPRKWVARVKNALKSLAWRFNSDRMVLQYARECYLPFVGGSETG